ncbi:MAG: hypothetical protein ACK4WH_08700 [Phycisphaerales bacterium]
MMNELRGAAVALASVASALAGGCNAENVYGVDIQNRTGQEVLVEFLDVGSDGSARVYSSARLPSKGTFSNRVSYAEHGYGKRVRFSLPDRPAEDLGAKVELKLPEEQSRYYDLKLKNGRLMAEEYPKGREPTASSDLAGGV